MARIAIVGAGSIGCAAGAALLKQDGNKDEVLVFAKQNFKNITVNWPEKNKKEEYPVKVATSPDSKDAFDWVILCVKGNQTASTTNLLKTLVGKKTKVAVIQNGVEHRSRVSPFLTSETPIVPVVIYISSSRTSTGQIDLHDDPFFYVENDANGKEFADLFKDSFIKGHIVDDFKTKAWEKLCFNVAIGPLTAITSDLKAIVKNRGLSDLAIRIIDECVAVGQAEGAKFKENYSKDLVANYLALGGTSTNSMYADRIAGHPLEYDPLNGAVVRFGKKYGIQTPINDTLVALLDALSPKD